MLFRYAKLFLRYLVGGEFSEITVFGVSAVGIVSGAVLGVLLLAHDGEGWVGEPTGILFAFGAAWRHGNGKPPAPVAAGNAGNCRRAGGAGLGVYLSG